MASRSSTPSNAPFWSPRLSGGWGLSEGPSQGQSSSSSSSVMLDPVESIGVTRSRTLLFLSYRDSAPRPSKKKRLGKDPLGVDRRTNGGTYFDASGQMYDTKTSEEAEERRPSDYVVDIPSLPPQWVDVSDEVDQILRDLGPKMVKLDKLHSKHLLPGFVDRSAEEREIEVLSSEITKEFRRSSKLIASLQSLSKSRKMSSHELKMANNVTTALAQRVQLISGQFRKKQSNYMQRLKGQDVRHREVMGELGLSNHGTTKANAVATTEEIAVREDVELSKQQLQTQQSQQDQLLLFDSEQQSSDIQQRSNEINQIAKSIIELSELFQDLNTLIIDQGTLLDRIDYNIENMATNIQHANVELNTAMKSQKNTSKNSCILFLLLCCALVVVVIVTKPFYRVFFGGDTIRN
ncbi:unnamed protein product [Sympodiomycopsis kandeliae]